MFFNFFPGRRVDETQPVQVHRPINPRGIRLTVLRFDESVRDIEILVLEAPGGAVLQTLSFPLRWRDRATMHIQQKKLALARAEAMRDTRR